MVLELRIDANVEIATANSVVPPAYFSPSGNQNLLLLFLIWSYAEDRKNKGIKTEPYRLASSSGKPCYA